MRLCAVIKFESQNPKLEIHPSEAGKNSKNKYFNVPNKSRVTLVLVI